jgi:ubiquinone/menaquinone biosynthesis C-methylase UbiE
MEDAMRDTPETSARSNAAVSYYENGPELSGLVLKALRAAGRPVDPMDPDDLAGLDEFHGLGRAATLSLAELAGISSSERVLDVGAGIGGPARTLASRIGARVTALDPTRRFCELNQDLCRRTRLDGKVEVVHGDARAMPLKERQYDVVWTQAVWPSVDDKRAMLSEIGRVLKQAGRLALYEVVSGAAEGNLHYPVPWADGPNENFLVSPDELRGLAESAGFEVLEWLEPPDLLARIGETAASHPHMATGVERITLALVMPNFEARMASLARNLSEQRISMVMAVLGKS